jgi:hypothetical protein
MEVWSLSWVDVNLILWLPGPQWADRLSALLGIRLQPEESNPSDPDVLVNDLAIGGFQITAADTFHEVANESDLLLRVISLIGSLLLGKTRQLIVHAGAIVTGEGALLFCGPSYVGKSTLGFYAWKTGLDLLGDDRVVFHSEEASVSAFPKPLKPRVPIGNCPDFLSGSATGLMGWLEGEAHWVVARSQSGIVPLALKVPIQRIIFLERSGMAGSQLRQLAAQEALPRWLNQIMLSQCSSRLETIQTLEHLVFAGRVHALDVGEGDIDGALQLMLSAA